MGCKLFTAAVLAAVLGANAVEAQSVARVGGPANLPPPGFTGQQFIDSRGCVFLRAGYGGQTTWVPRVGRNRKAMCGLPPSSAARAAIEVATEEDLARPAAVAAAPEISAPSVAVKPAPKPAPTSAPVIITLAKPAPVATAPAAQVAPVVMAAPARPAPYVAAPPAAVGYEIVADLGPASGKVGCYSSAPVAERVRLRTGGTAVVCTRGDGTLTGWRPPVYARDAGVGASLSAPAVARADASPWGGEDYTAVSEAIPAPPKGYKLAWDDGRLNPMRGKGTVEGWAEQDQVWNRKVPATLAVDKPRNLKKRKLVSVQPAGSVTLSTKGQAPAVGQAKAVKVAKTTKAAKGGAYIQVGTFGLPSNADGASTRLSGLGLPVARARITSGGKAMQIVMAGPFGSAAEAQAALSMARAAGFGDAFIR